MSQPIRFAWIALTTVFVAGVSTAALADSHVRIVRLSSVEGQVQMDRGIGGGLERAILNSPIVEGTRLVTGGDGLAEVEFENESALRLADNSEVKFAQLLMSDTGAKINQFQVVKGLVYLDTASKGDDIYRVKVGDTSLLVHRDTLMRLSADPDQVQVAVLKGDVQLENQPPVSIHKKETLTVNLKNPSKYEVTNGTDADRFDAWNKEREDYSRTYADNAGYGGPSRGYGLQDLNYYGDFFYAGGYGYVWQPYGFASSMINWNPYSNGAWMFYPGMGYAWASAYPWGWLPYHYGSWAFINGAGWAWLPGGYSGQWYATNFVTVPTIRKAPTGWTAATPPAINAAAVGVPRTVLVGSTSSALTIPGGRIPPNFASLVPGRSVGAATTARGFVKPNAQTLDANRSSFAAREFAVNRGGHVFAARPVPGSADIGPEPGGFYGGNRAGGIAGPRASSSIGVPAAHASSGVAAHK